MSYIEQQKMLRDTAAKLPPKILADLPDQDVTFLVEEICDNFNLTMGEIGEICELVRQIITKERKPEDLEAGLKEKLDEDNVPLAGDIVGALSREIFLKLLPALNIKVPLDMAMAATMQPKKSPTDEGVKTGVDFEKEKEIGEAEKISESTPAKKPAENSVNEISRPTFPPISSEPPVEFRNRTAPVPPMAPPKKPTVVEIGHERMSDNPIESLMRMLEGKVNQQELEKHYDKLPQSLKVALESVDSAKKVVDVGRKYGLHVDKLGELGAETGMVILGFTHPGQFLGRLTRRLGMSENAVRPIAQEINTEIFLKIREALKEVNGETITPDVAPQARVVPISRPDQKPPVPIKPVNFSASSIPVAPQVQAKVETPAPVPAPSIPASQSVPQVSDTDEEMLDREALLQDIENPKSVIRPSGSNDIANVIPATQEKNIPVRPASQKTDAQVPPAAKIETKKESIFDRKLSGTTNSSKSETLYSSDPYREPTE